MIRRLYVNNFRCLENFELRLAGQSSVLLIGRNGSGKTAVGLALEILRRLARGTNRVRDLIKPKDITWERGGAPVRFEIEAEIKGDTYEYAIAFELPEGSRELRVTEEKLAFNGRPIYTRKQAEVDLAGMGQQPEGRFRIDWHLVALPVVQEQTQSDPLYIFKRWLARMLILRPIPSLITGDSNQETLEPNLQVTDFGAWFSGLIAYTPAAYGRIDEYLKLVIPDLMDIKNPVIGKDSRSLVVQFNWGSPPSSATVQFEELSDGEKCFMICAMVLAANHAYGPLICFWDEPDNYLSLDEVGHFVLALRKAFQTGGQLITTSHNPEAIRVFSDENTLFLHRRSHLDPTTVRPLSELQVNGDLVGALIRGDVEP